MEGGGTALREALAARDVNAVTFTSSSTVQNCAELFSPVEQRTWLDAVVRAAIGPITAADVCVLPAYERKNCGAVEEGTVRNDPLPELIARVAVSHAEARADLHEQASIPRTSTRARAHLDPSREQ